MIAENEKDDTKKGSRDREKVCRQKRKRRRRRRNPSGCNFLAHSKVFKGRKMLLENFKEGKSKFK